MFETIKEQNIIFVNHIELNDEFNRDEICDYINKINNLIIKADIPGAGKSSAFTYNSDKINEKTLFITPYNSLCFELRKQGQRAIT